MFTKDDIENYFFAEKQLGLILLIIGAIAIVLAIIFFLALKTNFYKGLAVPLLIGGIIQLAIGISTFGKSDDLRVKNVYAYNMNTAQLKNEELPRVTEMLKNISTFKWVEIVLMATGVILIFYFRDNRQKAIWMGLGMGLAIQAIVLLAADFTAEKKAALYAYKIELFFQQKESAKN